MLLIEDEEWRAWSDREIGRQCVVHHETVARIRADHLAKTPDAPRTVSRGGNVYTMETGAIGRKPAAAPPEIPADEQAPAEPQPEPTNIIPLAPHLPELPTP